MLVGSMSPLHLFSQEGVEMQNWSLLRQIIILIFAAGTGTVCNVVDAGNQDIKLKKITSETLEDYSNKDSKFSYVASWPTTGKACKGITVKNTEELIAAIDASKAGDTIALTSGVFEIPHSLILNSEILLCGQGADKTIVRGQLKWQPSSHSLPKTEEPNAYLFIVDRQNNVTIRDMSLQGPNLHGAVYANRGSRLTLAGLEIKDFLWSGVRTFNMKQTRIHDNDFIDAGGRYKNTTGGALYDHFPKGCKVWNNRVRSSENVKRPFFGFKGRGGQNCRFHHNDIRRSFAIEYPFDNNIGFEIDHNYIEGTISIPKFGGGKVLEGEAVSFHIHHNVIRRSYAIEFARNNVRINHNLFDLDPHDDGGNLISNHGKQPVLGPLWMHDNLIRNIGRGIFWSRGSYNRIQFVNNHVRISTSSRKTALFQFHPDTNFQSIQIMDNIFEINPENPRPLLSNSVGTLATIQNNTLKNISDKNTYSNSSSHEPTGLSKPLRFTAGVRNQIKVNQWSVLGVDQNCRNCQL